MVEYNFSTWNALGMIPSTVPCLPQKGVWKAIDLFNTHEACLSYITVPQRYSKHIGGIFTTDLFYFRTKYCLLKSEGLWSMAEQCSAGASDLG